MLREADVNAQFKVAKVISSTSRQWSGAIILANYKRVLWCRMTRSIID